jgi:DNA phosphorothioation-dependent restriction protein DptG
MRIEKSRDAILSNFEVFAFFKSLKDTRESEDKAITDTDGDIAIAGRDVQPISSSNLRTVQVEVGEEANYLI